MDIYESASKGSGWIKFFGIINIIMGGLQALTIVGILWAWIPIWVGVVALQTASAGEKASINKNETDLIQYHFKIKFLFQLIGIFIIIGLVIGIIILIFSLIFSAFIANYFSQFGGSGW